MDLSNIDFIEVKGSNSDHEVLLFALSTCGFCKRAIDFLNENSVSYKYIHADIISAEIRTKLKEEYKKKYGNRLLYPTAIIDGEKILNGFIKPSWERAIISNGEK